jgi:hypothetical protein
VQSITVLEQETGSVPGGVTFNVAKDAKIDWDLAHREQTKGELRQLLVCEREHSAADALIDREGQFLCAEDSDVGFSRVAHAGGGLRSVVASVAVGVIKDPREHNHCFAEPRDVMPGGPRPHRRV